MNLILNFLKTAACTALAAVTAGVIYYDCVLPDDYYVAQGGSLEINEYVEVRSDTVIPENYGIKVSAENYRKASSSVGAISERTEQLRLFGVFPIKNVTVTEVAEPVVVPCGTPFGIKLMTEGVLVVELTGFECDGSVESPARQAGISEGDVIVSISGKPVSSNNDVSRIISASKGKTLGVELVRDGENRIVFLRPELSDADDTYHAGMWVRDSSAGIGTVTFYDPSTGMFAGLGHPVCDSDTGELLTMSSGEAAEVLISGIKKSSPGNPGELVGMFASDKPSGRLVLNCENGIYGYMDICPSVQSAVPVAMKQEVRTGPAEIYATVNGMTAEKYSVEIEKIDLKSGADGRNMVVRVTDERLLEKAGGIVQGMSGSPIIQNGKLVGAVTHVFVRDPERGYAIFADTMLEQAACAAH